MSYTAAQARERYHNDSAYAETCRAAHRKWYQKRRVREIKKKTQEYRLKKFGLTPGQYEGMVRAQDGLCFICRRSPGGLGKALAVDHDHDTGVLRKLLCHYCNTAVGLLNDDARLARCLADYLEAYHAQPAA